MKRERLTERFPDPVRLALKGSRRAFRRATAGARRLPDFVILGGQRCGTSSLYDYLVRHPDVLPAETKEVHFFDRDYAQGLDRYRASFPLRRTRGITGEATPYYLFHPLVPERLAAALPDARLLVLLRDPVDRAFSHFEHEVAAGREHESFEDALRLEPERLERGYGGEAHANVSYRSRGLYAEQLERWFAHVPRERFLVLRSEDLFARPHEVVADAQAFLGLGPHALGSYEARNVGRRSRLSDETRAELAESFAPPNARLAELLGWESTW